jgi:glucosamine--fructose-6-phosphate aminotransferase (isomerizing)
MCGIVGAVARRDVGSVLLEGLRRLEYRGYDSAGIAVLNGGAAPDRVRVVGKVSELAESLVANPLHGRIGIAHTRWATHGRPTLANAHPHVCDGIAVVHNGIIENHAALRSDLERAGVRFETDTDTEVALHEIRRRVKAGDDLLEAVRGTVAKLRGYYALAVISAGDPERLIAARSGCPLVVGLGDGEHYVASDIYALLPVTRRFIVLEDGEIADLRRDSAAICDRGGRRVERAVVVSDQPVETADKAGYRHYMQKEIFSQPAAVAETLRGRIRDGRVLDESFGAGAAKLLDCTTAVHFAACGTSYHAALIARYWLESIAGIPCSVEVASEYRHRRPVVPPGTLFVAISQSGETADTLAALRIARGAGYVGTLAICNVPESTMTREAELLCLTRAGPEIGVASTKAFTTQLTVLLLLVLALARRNGLSPERETELAAQLESLPGVLNHVLDLDQKLARLSERFVQKHHALYLGRGTMLPVAMEGALKLKEISYIHAEAYPAGELKHGPLALVDEDMPVIAVAPNNELLEKLKSNLQEVRARGGELYVLTDAGADMEPLPGVHVIDIAPVGDTISPIVYVVPLQLFAYHVAVLRGADVDQPRNLAKSVTVE